MATEQSQITPSDINKGKAPEVDAQPNVSPVEFKVWNPPKSSGSVAKPVNLPDSYFEPTAAEVMSAYNAQVRARESLLNAPLKTQAIRDMDTRAKLAKWPITTIRVKFPDMTQLERTFPSTNVIKSVYAFVRNSLRDDVKHIKFILYQSPPRREFKVSDPAVRNLTLFELQLSPSSVLMLSFLDESLNHPSVSAPLLSSILSQAVDLPSPPSFDDSQAGASSSKGKASTKTAGKSSDSELKVPKWLKLGQKK